MQQFAVAAVLAALALFGPASARQLLAAAPGSAETLANFLAGQGDLSISQQAFESTSLTSAATRCLGSE